MKKIIDWFKESNRGLHLLLGVVVGLLPTGCGIPKYLLVVLQVVWSLKTGNGEANLTLLTSFLL